MPYSLHVLDPQPLWRIFETLTTIPRPSRREDTVIEYVRKWAVDHGLEATSAGGRNLLVRVPASPGREEAPTLILQGHLDMVSEREPGSQYDPAEGRIGLLRDGDWLTADGTTLGADDGIGIAAMMAVAEDGNIVHGPLELLMTVAEEVGPEGVNSVDGALLSGRMLLNLDSEEDGRLTVGCAGGTDTSLGLEAPREAIAPGETAVTVTVSGAVGGHSGTDIAHGRANAIKVLGRVLRDAYETVPFRLASVEGGKSHNAIPRDASAVCVMLGSTVEEFASAIAGSADTIRDEYARTDPNVGVKVESAPRPLDAWPDTLGRTMLDVISLVPSGPIAMSPDFAGLVETSTSLGVATTDGDRLELHSLTRTSNESSMGGVVGTLSAIARLAGGTLRVEHGYAGWRPELDSPLLALATRVWEDAYGEKPVVTSVHAGLETALIGEKVPGMDMLSIGPQIESPHSPDERVSIPTVRRFWTFLVGIIEAVAGPATLWPGAT